MMSAGSPKPDVAVVAVVTLASEVFCFFCFLRFFSLDLEPVDSLEKNATGNTVSVFSDVSTLSPWLSITPEGI